MAEKVLMLALSPTMETGTIVKWNVKVGDSITQNQVICEVETDKATMDYESMYAGVVLKLIKLDGQGANIGESIAVVGNEGEDISALLSEIALEGQDDLQASDKTSANVSETSSTTNKNSGGDTSALSKKVTTNSPLITPNTSGTSGRVIASPLARKLAKEKGINIESIQGSGPNGRIVKKDIENAKMSKSNTGASLPFAQDIVSPVKGVRAIIAQRLSESKFSAPHFYVKNTVRIESMMGLRATMNTGQKEKLSLNAFIIKFVAEAIKQHSEINSSWDSDGSRDGNGDTITQYASIDISLAVDLGDGLFTPVVRNCGNKGICDIDEELKILIEKVRDKTIAPDEYSGATFTISNLGSFGIDEFTAIINPPGASILAIGRGRKVPVVNEQGLIEVGNVMTISLSSDHRVIDGSLAGRFVAKLQAIIENPGIALL